jgi:hypothetical protein
MLSPFEFRSVVIEELSIVDFPPTIIEKLLLVPNDKEYSSFVFWSSSLMTRNSPLEMNKCEILVLNSDRNTLSDSGNSLQDYMD